MEFKIWLENSWTVDKSPQAIEQEQWSAQGEVQQFLSGEGAENLFGKEVKLIPISSFDTSGAVDMMSRRRRGPGDYIEKLKKAMLENVPIPPITLWKTWTGRWRLVSGRHRIVAALELNMTDVPALLMYWR